MSSRKYPADSVSTSGTVDEQLMDDDSSNQTK